MTIQEALKISKFIRRTSWNNTYFLKFLSTGVEANCNMYEKSDEVLGSSGLLANDWVALMPINRTKTVIIDKTEYEVVEKPLC